MVSAHDQQRVVLPHGSRVCEYALQLRILRLCGRYRAQNIRIDPRVAAQVVQVHLVVVANLLLVVSMGVATEDDQVIADQCGRVKGSLTRYVRIPKRSSWVHDFRPVATVQLEGEQAIGEAGKPGNTRHNAPVDNQRVGRFMVISCVRHYSNIELFATPGMN